MGNIDETGKQQPSKIINFLIQPDYKTEKTLKKLEGVKQSINLKQQNSKHDSTSYEENTNSRTESHEKEEHDKSTVSDEKHGTKDENEHDIQANNPAKSTNSQEEDIEKCTCYLNIDG